MTVNTGESMDTRQRVLEAAGEVFAEKGFERATIREIVERAGANLNAVNYYFRDKHGLYVALFEEAHQQLADSDQVILEAQRDHPPEQRLRTMIAYLLRGFVLKEQAPWRMRLLLRELAEPTGVMDLIVERFIRPRFEELTAIVRELMPPRTSNLAVRLCAESILGQCAHIAHRRAVVSQLIPGLEYTPAGIELIAAHIAEFSLAALQNFPRAETEA